MELETKHSVQSFAQNRWAGLSQVQLPSSLFLNGVLELPNDALSIYPVLFHLHQNKMKNMAPDQRHNELFAKVKVSQQTLMRYTGFSINKITSGTDALEEFGLIETESHRTKAYYIKRPLKQPKQEMTTPGTAPILGDHVKSGHT